MSQPFSIWLIVMCYIYEQCVRDSNPWPYAWQAYILTIWTNALIMIPESKTHILFIKNRNSLWNHSGDSEIQTHDGREYSRPSACKADALVIWAIPPKIVISTGLEPVIEGPKPAVLPITPRDIKKVREVNNIHNYKIGTPYGLFLERVAGLKPAASTLARLRSNQLSYTRNLWSFSRFCALPANCASPHRTFRYSTWIGLLYPIPRFTSQLIS